jgi:6-aminohexanoate-oligomer endohydrolase
MPQPLTNDTLNLIPKTTFTDPLLEFDFPSLRIGVAEYEEGPTGCTLFHFPEGAQVSVDVRGGSHGTLLTDERQWLNAIVLAGGSLMGLEAATGVTAELFARTGYSTDWNDIPVVSGGIIFDYKPRENSIYPDKELGRAALRTARPGIFPLGRRGAGASASVGKGLGLEWREMAGQGGAFRQIGPTKIAVFSVLNAVGALVDREGKVMRGNLDPATGERLHYIEGLARAQQAPQEPPPGGNTTLTVVVTNQRLDHARGSVWALRQVARMVHTSMARCIQPFHTLTDGDVLWAATTNEVDNPALTEVALGALASEVAWDAVLSCVQE